MVRSRGFELNRSALDSILLRKRLSMTEAADMLEMPLKTLSSLATGHTRASITTVRVLTEGLGCDAEELFPQLAESDESDAVAS